MIAEASSPDLAVRRRAITALGHWFGKRAAPALPVLKRALGDPDEVVVAEAAFALGKIGAPAREAVPKLVEVMESGRGERMTGWCAMALARIGADAPLCVPALHALLRDGDLKPDVGIYALGVFGPEARAAVPDIITYLGGEHAEDAMIALGSIGEGAEEAVPVLISILVDPNQDDYIREIARGTLVSIGRGAVPALMNLIREKGSITAITAIGELGPEARAAVPALVEVLEAPERETGVSWNKAAWALTWIGYDPTWKPEVVAALRRAAERGVKRAEQALSRVPAD